MGGHLEFLVAVSQPEEGEVGAGDAFGDGVVARC